MIAALILMASAVYGGERPQLAIRLESIIIPELTITTQPLNKALDSILAACAKTQSDGWVPGVILNLNGTPEPIVSLQAENISVLESIQRIGGINGLSVTVEENAIVIKPEK